MVKLRVMVWDRVKINYKHYKCLALGLNTQSSEPEFAVYAHPPSPSTKPMQNPSLLDGNSAHHCPSWWILKASPDILVTWTDVEFRSGS